MAASFRRPSLGLFACDFIERLLISNSILSPNVQEVLQKYNAALMRYSALFPAEYQIALLSKHASYAGFIPGSPLCTQEVRERWYYHERAIEENYRYCQRLIALLDQYLACCKELESKSADI